MGLQPVNDEDEFGHGFLLAGAMFIHLLGMRSRFELLDFSQHMLKVASHEAKQQTPETGSAAMAIGMVDAVRDFMKRAGFISETATLICLARSIRFCISRCDFVHAGAASGLKRAPQGGSANAKHQPHVLCAACCKVSGAPGELQGGDYLPPAQE